MHYSLFLQSTKQKLNGLRSEMDALRQEFEQKRIENQHTFQEKIEETNRKLERLEGSSFNFASISHADLVTDPSIYSWTRSQQKLITELGDEITSCTGCAFYFSNSYCFWPILSPALNDLHIFENHIIPVQDLYDSLKVEGCNYCESFLFTLAK